MLTENIFYLLKANNVSQYQLAKTIGVSAGNVTDWKSGKAKPSSEAIINIARFFNVSTDYLLGLDDSTSSAINQDIAPHVAMLNKMDKFQLEAALTFLSSLVQTGESQQNISKTQEIKKHA